MPTISQDSSRGRTAEEDSRLASFAGKTTLAEDSRIVISNRYDYTPLYHARKGSRKAKSLNTPYPLGSNADGHVAKTKRKRHRESSPDSSLGINDPLSVLPELPRGKHHRILHRVFCTREDDQAPGLYTDLPTRTFQSGHYHLSGQSPVVHLQSIAKHGSLAFIVFRDMACKQSGQSIKQHAEPVSESHTNCDDSIEILDPDLRSEIDSVARCAQGRDVYLTDSRPSATSGGEEEVYHKFFYYHRGELAAKIPAICSPTKEYLQDLLSFIQESHGALYDRADMLFAKGLAHRDLLEMLFCPNDIVVSKQEGQPTAFVIRSQPSGSSTLKFDCWRWGYDGQRLRRKSCSLSLARPLKATFNIRDLEIYPMRYASDEEKNYLLQRGQKFWNLRHQTIASYTGWDSNGDNFYSDQARCMIDYNTYRRMHPDAKIFAFSSKDIYPFDARPESISQDTTLSQDDMILLPPYIHGYFLKDKEWVTLLVDQVGPVTWNKDAYERLVLPKTTKNLVKALVMVRAPTRRNAQGMGLAGKRKRDDLIGGKGNGLIMLLHGGPGTGKTLTAESVAEIAEMPLFRVTCGDIGTNPEAVEEHLRRVLLLGKTWNCVLLLDEADVFLEERSLSDLERNSLVSVFLRVLEYYDGILILTSNRVGTFDEAFKSRIQVPLYYDPLGRAERKKIWENFFDMLETDEEDVNLDELNRHLDELADDEMNGRQIRNTLTTARQLALFQKETLGWEHLEQALWTARKFNRYIQDVQRHTDDQYARERELR